MQKKISKIDISENEVLRKYPKVLGILLHDRTTNKNIFWATNNYKNLGDSYNFHSPIYIRFITGLNGRVIMPRIAKNKMLQNKRVKDMAEVFTPAYICNSQNNLVDEAWFKRKNIFNKESDGYWETNYKKITFPKNKTWKDYVKDKRLEIACGEAPYITSRYDTVTGEFIPIKNRIGILDRKIRVVNENTNSTREWLKAVDMAFKSTYAYEWQGDSLLLAREAMMYTFIENYIFKFNKKPPLKSIQEIANVISWNVWQMDGLKGVVPDSCQSKEVVISNLFDEDEVERTECSGCREGNIEKHSGIYCVIKDWSQGGKNGRKVKFIETFK